MVEPKHKAQEKEDYGGTGQTRKKPDQVPQEGPAPVHRGEDNDAALADVEPSKPAQGRDVERPR